MRGHFLAGIILKLLHTLVLSELFLEGADIWQDSHFDVTHVEEQVGIVLPIHRAAAAAAAAAAAVAAAAAA